jgi:hypothetical protein
MRVTGTSGFHFHVTYEKFAWVFPGAPIAGGGGVGAGLSSMGGGSAQNSIYFPEPSMGKCDQASHARDGKAQHWPDGFGHPTTRKGWKSQSASRAQCVWRGTDRAERPHRRYMMSAAGSDDREIGSRAGTISLRRSHHKIL